jgi:DNA-binding response OmpR family regulator
MWKSHNTMNDAQTSQPPNVRVLIVEDDTPLAMMMANLLTRAGCEVHGAHTGEKALRLAQEIKFDLITLDVDLPDMSGFEICLALKERHLFRHTPIIFISARPWDKDRQRIFELGAVDYITKPFGMEFAPRLLSHIESMSNGFDNRAEPFASITKNAESDRAKVLHDIADKVL